MRPKYTPEQTIAAFHARVKRGEAAECWPWTGGATVTGYGCVWFNHRQDMAHRVAYILANGELPEGLHILHACDNPPCCNPAHLSVGTAGDNNRDAIRKGRHSHGPAHSDALRARAFRGESVPNSRLSESDVVRIRQSLASGETHTAIALRYGVRRETISSINQNRTWRHVQ